MVGCDAGVTTAGERGVGIPEHRGTDRAGVQKAHPAHQGYVLTVRDFPYFAGASGRAFRSCSRKLRSALSRVSTACCKEPWSVASWTAFRALSACRTSSGRSKTLTLVPDKLSVWAGLTGSASGTYCVVRAPG